MAIPTFVSFGSSAFNTSTSPKTVAISVTAGDRIVVMSLGEHAGSSAVNTAPTGGSETYTQAATLGTGATTARAIAWTATAASTQSYSVSCVRPMSSTTANWGCMVWVLRNSNGFGVIGAPTVDSTSNSVTVTTTQDNSALVIASSDFAAVDGTTRTRRTINSSTGAEDLYGMVSTSYTWYAQRYTDTGTAGSVTGGYSAPTGQTSAIIAVEVKGTAGGGPALPPELI